LENFALPPPGVLQALDQVGLGDLSGRRGR
jgi:hypothetical protein